MTTTDGHCLAQVHTAKTTYSESRTWLLPRRAIFELKKILETVQDTMIFLGYVWKPARIFGRAV